MEIQSRPDGPTAPAPISIDDAHTLLSALQLAIDGHDRARMQLDAINDAFVDQDAGRVTRASIVMT